MRTPNHLVHYRQAACLLIGCCTDNIHLEPRNSGSLTSRRGLPPVGARQHLASSLNAAVMKPVYTLGHSDVSRSTVCKRFPPSEKPILAPKSCQKIRDRATATVM